MKKILLPLLMLLVSNALNAQWSSMKITNHSLTFDYNVRLVATYDIFTSCNYEDQVICIPAGASISAPTYWDWACLYPFVTGPLVPDAPFTWTAATCGGVGTTAAPWNTPPISFDWRGALIWPCGTVPLPLGNNSSNPCGTTHFVGDGFCGSNLPSPPLHIWSENISTGDVTLDLY
jgi:hypothetical protein